MQRSDVMTEGSVDRDDLAVSVADALTRNQQIQWERCARLATPANRRLLDNLRALAPVFTAGDTAGPDTVRAAAPAAAGFLHRAVSVLFAIASLEVLSSAMLLPWRWDVYHRAHGDVAVYAALVLAGHGASAALLLFAGRRDRRTWLLGGYFLFRATIAPLHMLPAFWGQVPPANMLQAYIWEIPGLTMVLIHCGLPLALAIPPALLWTFARECPRVHRRTRLDELARRMVPVSVAISGAMCAGVASVYVAGLVDDAVSGALYLGVLDAAIATSNVLSLAAVVVVVLRAHTAPAEEVRRVVLFSLGLLVWMGMATAYNLVEAVSPGSWLSNYESDSVLRLMQPMCFPGMVLLWYSVLAVRVPHVREVVRSYCRRLLTHPGLLSASTLVSLAALGLLLASRPGQTVEAVLADPLAQALFAAFGIVLLVALGRERILRRIDAWVYPETTDQRHTLAAAATALAQAGRIKTVGRTLTRAVKHGCGSASVLLAASDPETPAEAYHAPDAKVRPLLGTSAIVHLLETVGRTLRVHPDDKTSLFELLPREEAAWVVETAADAIVPIPGPGGGLLGVLVAGRRFDDRTVRVDDLPFLEALAASAGLAIGRLMHFLDTASPQTSPARECSVCGYVTAAGEPSGCNCGSAYVETEVPKLLAGKFRLTWRLGRGGMGTVYLARDIRLDRDVAVKALTGLSVLDSLGLKPEARVMADVTHPAVAQIYGIESWRGRPFLVIEYLAGGTLADRLCGGPVPGPEALSMSAVLAAALAALHDAGYLHGDIKPSNIGFTSDGSPKLLDFGLAHEPQDDVITGGTLRYVSPEVLSGRPAGEADDVWSLCVVLYEMVSGVHPFAGNGSDEVAERIRQQRVGGRSRSLADSGSPAALTGFAASVLSSARSERPATARALAARLREIAALEA